MTNNFGSQGKIIASEGLEIEVPVDSDTPEMPEPEFGEILVNTPSLYWGNITQGGTVLKEITVTNTLGVALQLSLSTSNWIPPEAEQFLTLTWDYNGVPLRPSQNVSIYLQLYASPLTVDITAFSFDINILGVQAE